MNSLFMRLTSRDMWKRVAYFGSNRSLREQYPLTKQDILPLILMISLTILSCVVAGLLIWILCKYIAFQLAFSITVIVMTIGAFILKNIFKKIVGDAGNQSGKGGDAR